MPDSVDAPGTPVALTRDSAATGLPLIAALGYSAREAAWWPDASR
jgi:hypothetical protein